jgi:hypothetical protein
MLDRAHREAATVCTLQSRTGAEDDSRSRVFSRQELASWPKGACSSSQPAQHAGRAVDEQTLDGAVARQPLERWQVHAAERPRYASYDVGERLAWNAGTTGSPDESGGYGTSTSGVGLAHQGLSCSDASILGDAPLRANRRNYPFWQTRGRSCDPQPARSDDIASWFPATCTIPRVSGVVRGGVILSLRRIRSSLAAHWTRILSSSG